MNPADNDILGLLARHEVAIRDLYEAFAARFPGNSGFWLSLAADEQRHANWLAELRSEPAVEKWLRQEIGLKQMPLRISIEYVEKTAAGAKDGKISPSEALSIARDIEKALIEQRLSRMKGSAPKEARNFISNLARETERHLASIIAMIDAEGAGN